MVLFQQRLKTLSVLITVKKDAVDEPRFTFISYLSTLIALRGAAVFMLATALSKEAWPEPPAVINVTEVDDWLQRDHKDKRREWQYVFVTDVSGSITIQTHQSISCILDGRCLDCVWKQPLPWIISYYHTGAQSRAFEWQSQVWPHENGCSQKYFEQKTKKSSWWKQNLGVDGSRSSAVSPKGSSHMFNVTTSIFLSLSTNTSSSGCVEHNFESNGGTGQWSTEQSSCHSGVTKGSCLLTFNIL